METEDIRAFLMMFPKVTEETPFGPEVAVYKTAGKMFALSSWDPNPLEFNLKCDPQKAEELRDQYPCVRPGYHMNKKHWNTVTYDGSVDDELFKSWVEHSFECVVKSMPKKLQKEMLELWESREALNDTASNSEASTVDSDAVEIREDLKSKI